MHNWATRDLADWPYECSKCGAYSHNRDPLPEHRVSEHGFTISHSGVPYSPSLFMYSCEEYLIRKVLNA